MSLLHNLLLLLASLAGIGAGILLSAIAPEETLPGKRYFSNLKQLLFVTLALVILVNLRQQPFLAVIFALVAGAVFILDFKIKSKLYQATPYFLFLAGSFFYTSTPLQLLLASLLFLYGFPLGTLLRLKHETRP